MKKIILPLILSTLVFGCSSRLYSAVMPMEDGTLFTSTTAITKDKSLIRATRNAERYCKQNKNGSYAVINMKTMYEGIYDNEKAANTVQKSEALASKLTLGLAGTGSKTDYRTELSFKCLLN